MWHEISAPRTTSDVAWSHQKVNELTAWLRAYAAGSIQQILVMSGPSGSGKLSTLNAIFPTPRGDHNSASSSAVKSSAAAATQQLPAARLHVLHGLEGGVEELSGFLGTARLRAQMQHSLRQQGDALMDVFVVKGLPGDGGNFSVGVAGASSATSSLRQQCLRALNCHLQQLASMNATSRATGGRPVQFLTVMICTIHDSHSEKVALNDYFGPLFMASPLVHKFRCTSVTERNMAIRLQAVGREHRISFIDPTLLGLLCESAHGDMRQALLQMQWALLTAPRSEEDPPRRSSTGPWQGGAKPSAMKRSRTGPVAARGSKKLAAGAKVLDLIEDPDDEDNNSEKNLLSPAPGADSVALPAAKVFCRDDSIDLAHGAARLLTQKYTLDQLRAVLSAPPWKLFGFVVNNLHMYFYPHQIAEYSSVARVLSWAEPQMMMRSDVGSSSSSAALRATEEERLLVSTAEMCLTVLCAAYRTLHHEVRQQNSFTPHCPPPFLPFGLPKWIVSNQQHQQATTTASRSFIRIALPPGEIEHDDLDDEGYSSGRGDTVLASYLRSHSGSKNGLMTEYGLVRECVMCADRRTCSLPEFILDYYPMAKMIVVDIGGSTVAAPPGASGSHGSRPLASLLPSSPAPPRVPAHEHLPGRVVAASNFGIKRTILNFGPRAPQVTPIREAAFAAMTSFDNRLRTAAGLRKDYFSFQESATELVSNRPGRTRFLEDEIEEC